MHLSDSLPDYSGRIGYRCPPYHFDCDPSRPLPLCVPLIALRNCRVDCPNMSDEWCGFGKVLCDTKISGLPCGRCVRFEDATTLCSDQKWKVMCNVSGTIKCSSTLNCVLPQWILDGKDDCGDGSDEEPCRLTKCSPSNSDTITSTSLTTTMTTTKKSLSSADPTDLIGVSRTEEIRVACEIGEFRCLSGECVDSRRVLDRVRDCVDNSDEKYCELFSQECSQESPCGYQPDIAAFGCGCPKGAFLNEKGICHSTKV